MNAFGDFGFSHEYVSQYTGFQHQRRIWLFRLHILMICEYQMLSLSINEKCFVVHHVRYFASVEFIRMHLCAGRISSSFLLSSLNWEIKTVSSNPLTFRACVQSHFYSSVIARVKFVSAAKFRILYFSNTTFRM